MESDEETGVVEYQRFIGNKDYETTSNQGSVTKGKYYKQTYRTAWEQMSDFKGWLKGVAGEPTRAFCIYCEKSLHAHRLSLLKHTCTIRHQKAAQLHFMRERSEKDLEESEEMESVGIVLAGSSQEDGEDLQETIQFETVAEDENEMQEEQDEEDEEEVDYEEEEESVELEEVMPIVTQKQVHQQGSRVGNMSSAKPVISTHVLDTSRGEAVSGLQVSLYKLIDGRWTYINEGVTTQDGRFSNFLNRDTFTAGRFKLHFDVDRYFELKKQDSLYPFIEIVFDCRSPGDHYHIPLLLGPYGYTTYRGT